MKRTKVTLTSDTNPEAKLVITRDEAGNIRIGATGAICILAKGSRANSDVRESLEDIINAIEQDIPIGQTVVRDGIHFTCTEAPAGIEGCDICAFKNNTRLCTDLRCAGEDRADRTDVIFQ